MTMHIVATSEHVSKWLGISQYEAHVLMHAIDEAYVVHSKKFTKSVLDIASTMMGGLDIVDSKRTDIDYSYSYVVRKSNKETTLIFNWTDHNFYISSLKDFVDHIEEFLYK